MTPHGRRRPAALRSEAAADSVRRIAVCADDFGLDPQVNAGALLLASLGRLSSVSCMVGAPHWRGDASALGDLDPQAVEAGLHLDLTEHPFDAGLRRPLPQWILRSHAGAVDRQALRREVDAQLDAFERVLQRPPAFVDGHEHVHQFPVVRDVLLEALAARGLQPWLRCTRRPPGLRSRKAWLIGALGAAALARGALAQGLRQNAHLLGVYDFDSAGESYLDRLRQWLALAADGDLLMCHPAAGWPTAAAHPAARCAEFAALASAQFGELLAQERVRIAPLQPLTA